MRAFVTGANGFVGRYLLAELRGRGHAVTAGGRARDVASPAAPPLDVEFDLADEPGMRVALADAKPDVVFHLAAQAFVPLATERPLETYDTNVLGTARLVEVVRALPEGSRPRVVFVSSGEVYGARARAELPLREAALPAPATPYAASKSAAEAIVLASARTYRFSAIVTRAFNQIGPGQSDRFVVPAFASRLARIAAGGDPVLKVGNLDAQRDFLDVRDVVRAYADLAERGVDGEIYNVCSGAATATVDILRKLVTIAHVGVEIREDPALLRAVDVPVVYGDNAKLREATGWAPTYALMRTLREIYDDAVRAIGEPV
jgi:GDP-4-dehydro-6-deoxy-D-mannose reductase